MTKILTRLALLGAVLLLGACASTMPEVRPDGTLVPDAMEDGMIRHNKKIVEIPIPDSCTGTTDCVFEVNGENKVFGGQMRQAFHRSMQPSEQCGGAPCPAQMTLGTHTPGMGDRALDIAEGAIPAVIGYKAQVDSAREYVKAGDNVAGGGTPVVNNVGVNVATQVLSKTVVDATTRCLRDGIGCGNGH